jgi:lipopolysaccharide transport system permease protein
MNDTKQDWDLVIKPKPGVFHLGFKDVWDYRDLIMLFVKRDIVAQYKQTILGPLWLVIQPLITAAFFTIIFGTFAKFDTGGIPFPVFTLSGLTIWNLFASSLNKTSSVFVSNSNIFGKVYFPRLTVPVSALIANTVAFLIQFFILLVLLSYYKFAAGYDWQINFTALFHLPFLLITCSLFGMAGGLIISSMTTKYRDLGFLVGFILQFIMYASAVAFPFDNVSPKLQMVLNFNPVYHLVLMFRAIMISSPMPDTIWIAYSTVFMMIVLFLGILIFNRVSKTFMDTV